MIRRRGAALRKHSQRLAWLAQDITRYAGVPGLYEDVDDVNRIRLDALVQEMVTAGLLGANSPDTRKDTVRRLVSELRGEQIQVTW